MLNAIAALRNASLDFYKVSPNCREGHLLAWKAQLESHGLCPFENAIRHCDLHNLLQTLDALTVPEPVPGCGCVNFTPDLPQQLQKIICQALDRVPRISLDGVKR